ncbi:kinesin-like protein [Flagelloscypha sp. PMI_526]|nr:kinesin-like protein [Flagelloscypha sp. PMI_526]
MSTQPKATRASARTKVVHTLPSRTTRAKASTTANSAATPTPAAAAAPRAARKPLGSRNVDPPPTPPQKPPTNLVKPKAKASPLVKSTSDTKESIQAFLRIRPYKGTDAPPETYLSRLSDSQVRLTDPRDDLSKIKDYTFSTVFPEETSQSEFFQRTTLPLVKDVLDGQNCLLFAHGVTGSGKTYTMNGGAKEGTAGILPRTFDVIFNSIKDHQGDLKWIPARLAGVEKAQKVTTTVTSPSLNAEELLVKVLPNLDNSLSIPESDIDSTFIQLDKNHRYAVFISYAEVYNEKVYDLFATISSEGSSGTSVVRKGLPLKSSPESEASGRYIGDLSQFRVTSAEEAKSLLQLGQLRRQVFGTLANKESSRSHAVAFIKILRCHKGELTDKDAVISSRLTLVDLAGSERNKVTQTSGDRLREAANINKSLMVLGHCLNTLRSNQARITATLAAEVQGMMTDTRDVKRRLSVVPYNNSTLTRILMDYFDAEGRTAMIVNVNPYETSYDELAHVMAFSAVAQDVRVNPIAANRISRSSGVPERRNVMLSIGGRGVDRKSEMRLEVLEEDEGTDDDDDYENNPLIDAMFDENEKLRDEIDYWRRRCDMLAQEVEETRQHGLTEKRRAVDRVEKQYIARLRRVHQENERVNDLKVELLQESGLLVSPVKGKAPIRYSDISSLGGGDSGNEPISSSTISSREIETEEETESDDLWSRESSMSPSAGKIRGQSSTIRIVKGGPFPGSPTKVVERPWRKSNFEQDMFLDDKSETEAEVTDGVEELTTEDESETAEDDGTSDEELDSTAEDPEESSDEEWMAPRDVERTPRPARASVLAKKMQKLKLEEDHAWDEEDSILIVPKKNSLSESTSSEQKKKRVLTKGKIMKEDEIEQATRTAERVPAGMKNIRRASRVVS